MVEFPFGHRGIGISVWRDGSVDEDDDLVFVKRLAPGDTVSFRTSDPSTMPLPHPLLFQLHAIMARILSAKASAGFPFFAHDAPDREDTDVAVSDGAYSSEHDEDMQDSASPPESAISEAKWTSKPRVAKRKAEDDVEDLERPRKVEVVLGEYEMRMQEKWAIASRRVAMGGAYWAY